MSGKLSNDRPMWLKCVADFAPHATFAAKRELADADRVGGRHKGEVADEFWSSKVDRVATTYKIGQRGPQGR